MADPWGALGFLLGAGAAAYVTWRIFRWWES